MAVTPYNPTTPARRGMTSQDLSDITTKKPLKSLVKAKKQRAGRNNQGRITVRHRGGGARRQIRLVDFKREKVNIPAKVMAIEYDPNRTARLALLFYADGEKRYIIAPIGIKVGDTLMSGVGSEIRPGNNLPLANIPVGTNIHAIELHIGKGAQMVRSAGTSAQLLAKEGKYAHIRMPSGEVRLVLQECSATIGQVGNVEHSNIKLGKAGRKRHLGRRPEVRGTAMSPRDHPHGGGEGRTGIGMPGPKTPWGKPALGFKTRRNKRTNDMIVRQRSKSKRK